MARRTSGVAEDLTDLVAMLPWWIGVLLALFSYLMLHAYVGQPVAAVPPSGPLGAILFQTFWKTLASVGQYLLPLICLAGAAVSAWRRRARKVLVAVVQQSQASDALDGMSWQEFEVLVGEGFRLQGYDVVETGGGGADGGVDLVLSRPGKNGSEKFLVQCKQWRAFKVGVSVVRELYGVMAAKGAAGGFVVTSGRFTEEAVGFASGRNLTLLDGPQLHGLLQQAKGGANRFATHRAEAPTEQRSQAPNQAANCPVCAKPMARRMAKRGASAGNEFWGCTDYPTCRGTRALG